MQHDCDEAITESSSALSFTNLPDCELTIPTKARRRLDQNSLNPIFPIHSRSKNNGSIGQFSRRFGVGNFKMFDVASSTGYASPMRGQ